MVGEIGNLGKISCGQIVSRFGSDNAYPVHTKRLIRFGEFKSDEAAMSTLEDFASA
jgi:hypothetical protein